MHTPDKPRLEKRVLQVCFLLLCVTLLISGCGRHTKTTMAVRHGPEPFPKLAEIQFTIQVGAFSNSSRAALYADRLQAAGLDAYYFIDKDYLYKVRLERFRTREEALRRAIDLKAKALIDDFFIVHPWSDKARHYTSEMLGENIVKTAQRFIGTDYRWGGTSPEEGFDCSGLTMTVYRLNGMDLPRNSREQFRTGTPVPRKALQAGDLVFFATDGGNRVSHVGIYSGRGQFIHAPSRGNPIRTASLYNTFYAGRYQGARRYF